jgi:G3E family GTPase
LTRIHVGVVTAGRQDIVDRWAADHADGRRAVVCEGLFAALVAPPGVSVAHLAPGCVCCVGQLPLRVTLTRLMRSERPDHLLLLLANAEHLPRVRTMLTDGSLGIRLELEGG